MLHPSDRLDHGAVVRVERALGPLHTLEQVTGPARPLKASMNVPKSIFRQYDVRGLVGSQLDADLARALGLDRLDVRQLGRDVIVSGEVTSDRAGSERADRAGPRLAATANLPTRYGPFALRVYEHAGAEYPVVVRGNLAGASPPLVRLHSECLTGEVLVDRELGRAGMRAELGLRIALSMAKDDGANVHGICGLSDVATRFEPTPRKIGMGQHGGFGTYEQAPFLLAHGNAFAPGEHPGATCIVDIAPTVMRHLGLSTAGMEGRALQGA